MKIGKQRGMINLMLVFAIGMVGLAGGYPLSKTAAPVMLERIQYQFEGGKSTLRLGSEDVIIDLGMILGEREAGSAVWKIFPTASFLLEMNSLRQGVTCQLDMLRFIERANGVEKRVFEPKGIQDSETRKGREPAVRFPKGANKFPVFWSGQKRCYIEFTFSDLPADIDSGDLVLTYQCKFPDKKYPAYYEERFTLRRKVAFYKTSG